MASYSENNFDKIICKYHGDEDLVDDGAAGDVICRICGLVVGDRMIDVSAEWRTFSEKNKEDPSRVGAAEDHFLNGSDLSTVIGPGRGKVSFYSGIAKYKNRTTSTTSTSTKSDKRLKIAYREIVIMSARINLTKTIIDRAKYTFKEVHDSGKLTGKSIEAIASACLYIACRQDGYPRTFKEICAICPVDKKEIGRCFKLVLKALEDSIDIISSKKFMSRFCANLGFPYELVQAATYIADKANELFIVPGRSPISVAAAAIYMASQASKHKKRGKEVGEICGVAESTIKISYKLMLKHATKLFPPTFQFTTPIEQLPLC